MRSTKSQCNSLHSIKKLKRMRMVQQPITPNFHNNSNNNSNGKTCLGQTIADKKAQREVKVSKKKYLMMKVIRPCSRAIMVIMAVSITSEGASSSVQILSVKGHSTHVGCATMRFITKMN